MSQSFASLKFVEQCRKHPDKVISVYCNQCNVSCCISCLAHEHQLHGFSLIHDKYTESKESLKLYVEKLEKDWMVKLENMKENITKNARECEEKRSLCIDEVIKFRAEITRAVNEKCDSLICDAHSQQYDQSDVLRDIDNKFCTLKELIQTCNEKISEDNLDIIEYEPPRVEFLLTTLAAPPLNYPVFEPGRNVLEGLYTNIGSVRYISEHSTSSPIKEHQNTFINVTVLKRMVTKSATSIITAGNNTAWITDNESDTMYLYSKSGKMAESMTVKKDVGISDLAIISSDEMLVTIREKSVQKVSLKNGVTELIDTAPFDAEGLCLIGREEIAVCMGGQSGMNHVAVYSSDGMSKLDEMRGKDPSSEKYMITEPFRVIQHDKNLCVINTLCNVVYLDRNDSVIWIYDGLQAKLEACFDPNALAKDKYLNILVSDFNNHCVHYIDKFGQLIQLILTGEQIRLLWPWGISVDQENGQVWIGDTFSHVVVARYID